MENRSSRSNNPYRIAVHILGWLPLIVLVYAALSDELGFNPIETALRWTGRTAVIFLLLSLTPTPIQRIFNRPKWRWLRKPLGLFAALYAWLHFAVLIIWDYQLNISLIWVEITNRPFIILGLLALIILAILSMTSIRSSRQQLGKWWTWFHRSVYLAGTLVIAHYLLAVKGDLLRLQGAYTAPLIALAVLILLLSLRIPAIDRLLRHPGKQENIEGN